MPVAKVMESPKYAPTTSWNSPRTWSTKKVKVDGSEKETPRCSCGGLFPLDTHPRSGEKCCAACYKDGCESLLKDLQIDHILFRQTGSVRMATRTDLIHASAEE